jgi:dephospho-CoA kinase
LHLKHCARPVEVAVIEMARLIAVTGFSGAGKTTAVNFLAGAIGGQKIYIGQLVLNEIEIRGLPQGPTSEQVVRLDLRRKYGGAGLAVLATPRIQQSLRANENVFLDAVLSMEELNHYRKYCDGSLELTSILTSFDIRAERLSKRLERKLSRDELLTRDDLEVVTLRTDQVIAAANTPLLNERSIVDFEEDLRTLISKLDQ